MCLHIYTQRLCHVIHSTQELQIHKVKEKGNSPTITEAYILVSRCLLTFTELYT